MQKTKVDRIPTHRPRRKANRSEGAPEAKQCAGHPMPHQLVWAPEITNPKILGAQSQTMSLSVHKNAHRTYKGQCFWNIDLDI